MRFFTRDDPAEPEEMINLLWRYEISEDGGENWRPECDEDVRSPDILRRGYWLAPPLN